MKEFGFDVSQSLTRGLSPDSAARRGDLFLRSAKNVVVGEYGLSKFKAPTDPFSQEVFDYPFPQFFETSTGPLLATRNAIYSVDTSAPPWELELLVDDLPGGGIWHGAISAGGFVLFNGNVIVYNIDVRPEIQVENEVTIRTGCSHQGRVLSGGFSSGDIWTKGLGSFLASKRDELPRNVFGDYNDLNDNWVAWSSIGDLDLPYWFFDFHPDEAGYGWDSQEVINRFHRNELGWMPLPSEGMVRTMIPLGKVVVVFTDTGIYALVPSQGGGNAPPTYGLQKVGGVPIAGRGAAAAGNGSILFLDVRGALWVLNEQLQIERLDYTQYLETLVGYDPVICYREEQQDYLLSGTSRDCYVLTSQGLTSQEGRFSFLTFRQGTTLGSFEFPESTYSEVETNDFDMSIRGDKQITQITARCKKPLATEIKVEARYGEGWYPAESWTPLNAEGVARVQVSGTDFRIKVRAPHELGLELDYLHVRYQVQDRRATRGRKIETRPAGS